MMSSSVLPASFAILLCLCVGAASAQTAEVHATFGAPGGDPYSGNGGWTVATVVPDFSYTVSPNERVFSPPVPGFNAAVDLAEANDWEARFGELGASGPGLVVRTASNGMSVGDSLAVPVVTEIVFDEVTRAGGWGLLLLDLDVEQVRVEAWNGASQYSQVEVAAWFQGRFDANSVDGVALPCFDLVTATAVGALYASVGCPAQTQLGAQAETVGAGVWLLPAAAVTRLRLVQHNLQANTGTPSVRMVLAAAVLPVASDDAYAVPGAGVSGNVADNDGNAGLAVTHQLVGPPLPGLTLNPDGSFLYVRPPNVHGSVSFSYQSCQSKAGNEAACSARAEVRLNLTQPIPLGPWWLHVGALLLATLFARRAGK